MTIPQISNLLALMADPLQTVVLQVVKPLPVWLGKFRMNYSVAGKPTACQLFEPGEATTSDLILVDGYQQVYLLRDGLRWPARLFGMASNSNSMMAFASKQRAGASRVKPAQSCLANGVLRIMTVHRGANIPKCADGTQTMIMDAEAAYWISQCDLMRSCEYNPDWRFIKPLASLRLAGAPALA